MTVVYLLRFFLPLYNVSILSLLVSRACDTHNEIFIITAINSLLREICCDVAREQRCAAVIIIIKNDGL